MTDRDEKRFREGLRNLYLLVGFFMVFMFLFIYLKEPTSPERQAEFTDKIIARNRDACDKGYERYCNTRGSNNDDIMIVPGTFPGSAPLGGGLSVFPY